VALRRWFAVEGEFTVVPRDNFEVISSIGGETIGLIYNRRRVNALFGVKAGYRGDRVGVFGRLRPGMTTLTDRGVECLQACAAILIVPPQYQREFAMDIGGTVELYWTARSLMRIDVGDLVIRHRDDIVAPELPGTNHNLTTRIGAGFRF
jgi:hypothetical protein